MPQKSRRVIVDTNLWVSFLLTSNLSELDDLIFSNKIVLLFSEELLSEFAEVVGRPKLKKYFLEEDLYALLVKIKESAVFVDVASSVEVCRDPKDDFLLALAKDGAADFLVSGDADLLELKKFGDTLIVNPKTLMKYFEN